jgi:ParB family transcriptional regulator, chromosome partitioning protein
VRGLKQNLVVVPAHLSTAADWPGKGKGPKRNRFEVVAGGRRLQAMRLLADDGRLPADAPIPCLIEDRKDASETSLSENLHKVAMNPADEFAAFAVIVREQLDTGADQSTAAAYTARRFGVTVRHVEGRLRLAALCPEVLDALRAGEITLDIAKAYAGTSDHDVQRTVFKAAKKASYALSARDIRNRLRGVTVPLDHHDMQFVGRDAYCAAGGRIEAEMFMGSEGEERAIDPELLRRLVEAKGTTLAADQARAEGWKEGLFTTGSAYMVTKPEGFSLVYHGSDQIGKKRRAECIAIYTHRGEAVELGAHFEPAKPTEQVESERVDWAAVRAAEQREREIQLTAARMAIGPLSEGVFKGTHMEGRTFWPRGYTYPLMDGDDDAHVLVAVQIRVPRADLETHREEATRLIDEQTAAIAEGAIE